MSKKMMKRSLALGALMAFVITGSAWAQSVSVTVEDGKTYTDSVFTVTDGDYQNSFVGSNVETVTFIGTSSNIGNSIRAYGDKATAYVANLKEILLKGHADYKAPFLGCDGGVVTIENVGSITTNGDDADTYTSMAFNAQGGSVIGKNIGTVYIYNVSNAIMAQTMPVKNSIGKAGLVDLEVTGDFTLKNIVGSTTLAASTMNSTDKDVQNKVRIKANNITIETAGTANAVRAYGLEDYVGKNKIELDAANNINITGGTAVRAQNGTAKGDAFVELDAINAINLTGRQYAVYAGNNGKVDAEASIFNAVTIAEDNAYGIYAEKTSQVDLGGTTINITAESANGEARAVNARGENATYDATKGSVINLGNADTENINVTVKGSGYGLISQYQGSAINVLGDNLTITGGGDVIGIIAQNQTVTTEGKVNTDIDYSDNAKVVIGEGTVTKIDVANGIGISAMSMGKVSVAGDLYVNAKTAVEARGDSVIEINKAGNKTVQLDGDILFDYADNSQTTINAAVDINLDNNQSYFKGSIIADPSTKQGEVAGMKLALSNGATWELTGASVVNDATFGKDSVLKIDGATFEESKGVYALNGTSDADVLQVEAGAKLVVDGIDEKTYNVAKGFETISESKWDIDNLNALMEGEWKETNGLQLVVSAKEASEMASDTGISTSTAGLVQSIIQNANSDAAKVEGSPEKAAVDFIENVVANNSSDAAVGNAINAATKMAEAGGNSATAVNIVKNVTGVTNDRLSFNCGHSAPHKGGHGVGLFEEGSGADIWVEYVHGKDEVEDMPSSAGATSYEGQFNGIVMGVDFKKVNKFQSGVAFNYGEGDTNSIGGVARTHSDYDFWGIGYYGNIHNDDSNVIFDINYAKTESDVTQTNSGTTFEASPETTTWSAGVKVEKLYQNENVQIVPYTGLRYMSIDSDDYSTKCGAFNYSMDRQDIWLLPLGVSIRQEVANDNGWTVSPRVDLSYIWAFGDTNSNMEVKSPFAGVSQLGYDVMDDGSFLGLVGIEAHKGQWGYGVSYSYQKGDHSTSKKWYVDVNYSF